MIKLFGKYLNLEEIFIGSMLQFPFYFLIHWWVLLLMPISGVLWALGGASESNKLFRRLGAPLASYLFVALYLFLNLHITSYYLVLAFIGGICSISIGYGESSFLYKLYSKWYDEKVIDYPVRITTYVLYWLSFGLALSLVK